MGGEPAPDEPDFCDRGGGIAYSSSWMLPKSDCAGASVLQNATMIDIYEGDDDDDQNYDHGLWIMIIMNIMFGKPSDFMAKISWSK